MANADVEDDGLFRKCAIYAHRSGGGHSIYFEEGDDYEGMGPGQCCGTYSYKDRVLRDTDGDLISIKNIIEHGDEHGDEHGEEHGDEHSEEHSEEESQETFIGVRNYGIE